MNNGIHSIRYWILCFQCSQNKMGIRIIQKVHKLPFFFIHSKWNQQQSNYHKHKIHSQAYMLHTWNNAYINMNINTCTRLTHKKSLQFFGWWKIKSTNELHESISNVYLYVYTVLNTSTLNIEIEVTNRFEVGQPLIESGFRSLLHVLHTIRRATTALSAHNIYADYKKNQTE